MEAAPIQTHKDIPDAEIADMALSPVTQEEMDAAMDALSHDELTAKMPEAEMVKPEEMDTSPVTEREMREAVDAIYFEEPAPVGDPFEKESLPEDAESSLEHFEQGAIQEATPVESDEEKIESLRQKLQSIPPAIVRAAGGPEGNPRHVSEFKVEKKVCERCKGTGKWFLFIRCPVCKGLGKIDKTMVFPDGRRENLSNH